MSDLLQLDLQRQVFQKYQMSTLLSGCSQYLISYITNFTNSKQFYLVKSSQTIQNYCLKLQIIFPYPHTITVNSKDWFTHTVIMIAFQKLFTEPNLKTLVVFCFQLVTLFSNTIHIPILIIKFKFQRLFSNFLYVTFQRYVCSARHALTTQY